MKRIPVKLKYLFSLVSYLFLFGIASSFTLFGKEKPNIILIFVDDLGYGDLGCYGSDLKTPNIDRLASKGLRATDCQVAANVCGPSRASLMTGRYPMRAGHPISRHNTAKYSNYGIAPEELTIAELLKEAGYYNKMIGKWHLGFHVKGSHPLDAGFDDYLGLHGNYANHIKDADNLYHNRKIKEKKINFTKVTQLYTDEAIKFIKKEHNNPFFLYFSHHIAHTPILPSSPFKKKAGKKFGVYGDFILELDHSVGQVLKAVEDTGIVENTLIVFLSDNGPARYGSANPLNGGKYVTLEGGHRVPAIFHWPGIIPAQQVSHELMTSMDLLPLFCHFANAPLPNDRKLDGKNIINLLTGIDKQSPHEYFYYYNGLNLQAVRKGKWKLHLPRTIADQPYWGIKKKLYASLDQPLLFNLDQDLGEKMNVIQKHPEIKKELLEKAEQVRAEIGDVHIIGSDQRPHGLVDPNIKG